MRTITPGARLPKNPQGLGKVKVVVCLKLSHAISAYCSRTPRIAWHVSVSCLLVDCMLRHEAPAQFLSFTRLEPDIAPNGALSRTKSPHELEKYSLLAS